MKKQLLRVKQIADQTFLRAEKTEVLTEDLVNAEKRVDVIKQSCQTTSKKIACCLIDFGSEVSSEKRLLISYFLKKFQSRLVDMTKHSWQKVWTSDKVWYQEKNYKTNTLRECANVQTKLGNEILNYHNEVEKSVLKPIGSVLDNEIHNINKLRKHLGKLTLDMDSARTRFQTAERHCNQGATGTSIINSTGKVDVLKDELEEASQKVDQCRDTLASEMFSLIGKEPQLSELFVHLHHLQASYHRNSLAALEASIPVLESQLKNFPQKPVYGCALEEHLRVTNRQIAQVIETCIAFLIEYGVTEEGLFRIAGSASKLKKLKDKHTDAVQLAVVSMFPVLHTKLATVNDPSTVQKKNTGDRGTVFVAILSINAFDAGFDLDMSEYIRDPHAVSGALKSYLRELPEPLMTFTLYEEWMSAAKMADFDCRLQALWQVIHKLPEQNFCNFRYIIKFLSKLHENAEANKMSSQNIAIVMAPNLIWSPVQETSVNFGINMSAANFHSSILEILIAHADWFFPEEIEFSSNLKLGCSYGSFNCIDSAQSSCIDGDSEENMKDALSASININPSSCSPKTFHRPGKKPAPPAPPVPKFISSEKMAENSSSCASTDLIDISFEQSDAVNSSDNIQILDKFCTLPPSLTSKERKIERSVRTSVIRRRSNENISSCDMITVNKQEKPNIPDKPASYTTYSLDRKLQRPPSLLNAIPKSYGSGDKLSSESSHRTQIERPSVPPPERPAKPEKPCKLSSSENLNASDGSKNLLKGESNSSHISSEQISSEIKCVPATVEFPCLNEQVQEDNLCVTDLVQADYGIKVSNQSKSIMKQNRFDFLVTQTSEKPPERPPRSVSSIQDLPDRTNPVCELPSACHHNRIEPTQQNLTQTSIATNNDNSILQTAVPPLNKISSPESDRPKPPRPQPPLPFSKPKPNNVLENTNL